MHFTVFKLQGERIGIADHSDIVGGVEPLLSAEHRRIDILPVPNGHDLLIEAAEHGGAAEQHTEQAGNRKEESPDGEHGNADPRAENIDDQPQKEEPPRNIHDAVGVFGLAGNTHRKIHKQSRRNNSGDNSIHHYATP